MKLDHGEPIGHSGPRRGKGKECPSPHFRKGPSGATLTIDGFPCAAISSPCRVECCLRATVSIGCAICTPLHHSKPKKVAQEPCASRCPSVDRGLHLCLLVGEGRGAVYLRRSYLGRGLDLRGLRSHTTAVRPAASLSSGCCGQNMTLQNLPCLFRQPKRPTTH